MNFSQQYPTISAGETTKILLPPPLGYNHKVLDESKRVKWFQACLYHTARPGRMKYGQRNNLNFWANLNSIRKFYVSCRFNKYMINGKLSVSQYSQNIAKTVLIYMKNQNQTTFMMTVDVEWYWW